MSVPASGAEAVPESVPESGAEAGVAAGGVVGGGRETGAAGTDTACVNWPAIS
ncbi:hypothetical protein [Streptomyces sp. NBC_01619]|uniref:hypothetical protein n=1 Tax=Streptomyces sp. NBC_01619 TaxID=2975901 RepID=UPI002258F1C9|nr:hypothetical protein [Streptomyces sp. NBC_01619]